MKLKVGIIGTGNIGTDLLVKISKSTKMELVSFVGQRENSDGIQFAKNFGVNTSHIGIDFFKLNPNYCDVVFDCTSAFAAIENNKVFLSQNIKVVDLTPAKLGPMCVPTINGNIITESQNVNMITCGGQTSIPILHLISKCCTSVDYIEIVSQVASKSAGIATRDNIDQYIHTTESAIKLFTNCKDCKVILNINPAEPCVDMQTTMFIKANDIGFDELQKNLYQLIQDIKTYVPKYEIVMMPIINDDGILILSIRVRGAGDYLPSYAGNLDIINCAAINVVERLL